MPLLFACSVQEPSIDVAKFDRERIIAAADKYLLEEPVTVTAARCERSFGGIHDFYSEGDYWWPDPDNPEGPYIRKDGQTNPGNFTAHRKAMRNLSIWVPALVAAYNEEVNAFNVQVQAGNEDLDQQDEFRSNILETVGSVAIQAAEGGLNPVSLIPIAVGLFGGALGLGASADSLRKNKVIKNLKNGATEKTVTNAPDQPSQTS